MIKLSQPKAYGAIKPLHDSTGRPIRCTSEDAVEPSVQGEDAPECADCPWRLGTPMAQIERTHP
jgi:hypothetical protein